MNFKYKTRLYVHMITSEGNLVTDYATSYYGKMVITITADLRIYGS